MTAADPPERAAPELPDRVRAACAQVAARAHHVRIDVDRVPAYAAALPAAPEVPGLDPEVHYVSSCSRRPCGHRLSPPQIDMILWTRGQEPRSKARPRPGARTTAY